jgi:hypothetical protein
MTNREWTALWWEEFRKLRASDPTADLLDVQKTAHAYMIKRYGACPPEDPGPPWWMKLGALTIGVPMGWLSSFWTFMNGKKTVVGLTITALAWLSTFVPAVMAALGSQPSQIAAVTGVLITVVGIVHKIYKFIYKEEHP